MTPTKHDIERAWGPLEPFSSRCAVVRACMAMHATGQVSELTAKLTAVYSLRFRIRELGGRDCDDEDLLFAICTAAQHSPVGEYGPLHALIASMANHMITAEQLLSAQSHLELARARLRYRPKPIAIPRTDSHRYAELRSLVEAWQSHQAGSSTALADWRHK